MLLNILQCTEHLPTINNYLTQMSIIIKLKVYDLKENSTSYKFHLRINLPGSETNRQSCSVG